MQNSLIVEFDLLCEYRDMWQVDNIILKLLFVADKP
jgi:hypothetical protein